MERKQKKTITKEIRDLIIELSTVNGRTNTDISKILNIHRHVVSNILKDYEEGREFLTSGEKRIATCKGRNSVFSNIEQTIYNSIAVNNALTQVEVQDIFFNAHGS